MKRRDFGSIRQTSAGRYQARYSAPDGTQRKGPRTFATKREASEYLAGVRASLLTDRWHDPTAPTYTLDAYFPIFQDSRRGRGGGTIGLKTRALSDDQYRRYIGPDFGGHLLTKVTPSEVSRWYASLPDRPAVRRQLYSLMKALFNQALSDGLIPTRENPCRIKGAGQNPPTRRPYFSFGDVEAVIAQLDSPLDLLARLAFDGHLRLGEVLALRWEDIDLTSRVVRVRRSVSEVSNTQIETLTKTARERSVVIGLDVCKSLREHAVSVSRTTGARVFTRPDGSPLRHFHIQSQWRTARQRCGLAELRFHDLRHVGLTMLAEEKVPLTSIMARAGHTTVNAALQYQHRSQERDSLDAEALEAAKSRGRRLARVSKLA